MKKLILIGLSLVLILALFSGCVRTEGSLSAPKIGKDNDAAGVPQGITFNKQDFKKLEYDKLPKQLQDIIDQNKEKGEVQIIEGEDNIKYVYIALGMRSSAGYDLEILHCEDVEGRISVVYQETKPAQGQPVADVITYPWIVIEIDTALPIDVTEQVQNNQSQKPDSTVTNPPIIDNGNTNPNPAGEFQVVDPSNLKEEMVKLIDMYKVQRGYMIIDKETLLIAAGEKPTGGYGIEVIDIQKSDNKVTIKIKETKPAPDAMVIQVITYPYVVISINTDLSIDVVDEGGNLLSQIKNTDM